MSFSEYSDLSTSKLFDSLNTSSNGLSDAQAEDLLKKFGENKIESRETRWWHILFRQLKSPFVYLLFAAFALAAYLGQMIDAGMILLFVGINTFLGFYQEYKSEQAVKLLKKYLVSKVNVVRGGVEKNIEVTQLVPGDLVKLAPGDIIAADLRFIETYNLSVDESVLTGESAPVDKQSSALSKEASDIYKAANIGFSGCTVVSGRAKAVVIATGGATNYAKIVALTATAERESTFEKELLRFSKFTLGVVLASLLFIVIANVLIKEAPSAAELALFSIALAVSVIPEALPLVTTFSLSIGALRLAKKKVVVKRLSAVEDLGGLQVLASDKTGTLTENVLTVDEIYGQDEEKVLLFANLASFYSETSRNQGNNAFDMALRQVLPKNLLAGLKTYQKISEMPFDPVRRRVSAVLQNGAYFYLVTRGSPEDVLSTCKDETQKDKLLIWSKEAGKRGRRVLAIAVKVSEKPIKDVKGEEKMMDFAGFVTFIDPLKATAKNAIGAAKKLGVSVKVLTGDSFEVATDVALKVGLIESEIQVITGADFEKLDTQGKHKAVESKSVFARVTPQQKFEIIKLLEEKYSVGFLGEGINDAPALKIANVAIVVQGAADVAKEASDIVLLERSLKVIIDGVEEGRRVFVNTSKYITATMTMNFGNFFAVSFVSLLIDFLPMLPLQILLVNLLSDFPMIFVATDTVDADLVAKPKHYNFRAFAQTSILLGLVSTGFDFLYFATFVNQGEKTLQTAWFMGSILTELLFLFSIRTNRFFLKSKPPSVSLMVLTVLAMATTITFPYTKIGISLFGFTGLPLPALVVVILLAIMYLAATEVVKLVTSKVLVKRND